jgi:hypothetical protein
VLFCAQTHLAHAAYGWQSMHSDSLSRQRPGMHRMLFLRARAIRGHTKWIRAQHPVKQMSLSGKETRCCTLCLPKNNRFLRLQYRQQQLLLKRQGGICLIRRTSAEVDDPSGCDGRGGAQTWSSRACVRLKDDQTFSNLLDARKEQMDNGRLSRFGSCDFMDMHKHCSYPAPRFRL